MIRFPLAHLPENDDTLICSCILSSGENRISMNKLFKLGRRLFQSPKRITRAKAYLSYRCEGNISGELAHSFYVLFKVSKVL